MKIVLTYLTAFKGHGGIEKFNKAFIKSITKLVPFKDIAVTAAYDAISEFDDKYYESGSSIKGYSGSKVSYLLSTLRLAVSANVLIIGHINLAIVGVIAKWFNPNLKIILIAHGIDVWYELSWLKKKVLTEANLVLAVSSFTRQKLIAKHGIPATKIKVFSNTLDPYLHFPASFQKPGYLLERYQLTDQQPVILSLCRLSAKEGYKGYDTIIEALPLVVQEYPDLKYVIVGKYDNEEFNRVNALAAKLGVAGNVILTGFVPDEELTDHYLIGDLFVMPSREEGFGIVYIEAMASGLPVIAGNIDGSVDALDHGKLGTLVDPTNTSEVAGAIKKQLEIKFTFDQKKDLQRRVIDKFGFDKFTARLNTVLEEI
ncbi:glycosyltransferase family 4 protein [Botryobacter ruber]|uniref:glycosyltransferase family 4 protein n=1 Tax=Botryobacter ruber TaxID=2171629 RepID=UPI000E0C3E70|nr:glycosyltransferase family 4 protein [Botryobacter ruber]